MGEGRAREGLLTWRREFRLLEDVADGGVAVEWYAAVGAPRPVVRTAPQHAAHPEAGANTT